MLVLVSNDAPLYCVTVTLDDWQGRATRMVAREIRRYRDERKMSAQQLADRTAELGMEVPRSVLANLESGRRETVTVPEILVLAAALQVTPIELLCPVGFDEQIEILPGRIVDPLSASRWVDGDLALDVTGPTTIFRDPASGEESTKRLIERHAGLVEKVHVNEAEVAQAVTRVGARRAAVDMTVALASTSREHDKNLDFAAKMEAEADKYRKDLEAAEAELAYKMRAAEGYREAAAQSLRYIRGEMRERGMLLPALPPSLRLDDEGNDAR
jgi:transcriptional regulator with XRE-family HTH domain